MSPDRAYMAHASDQIRSMSGEFSFISSIILFSRRQLWFRQVELATGEFYHCAQVA